MTVVIITEKPDASLRISNALAESDLKAKKSKYGVPYYEFVRDGKKHVVLCAVGHLFNLKQEKRAEYPVFNVKWMPSFEIRKGSEFTKRYFLTIEMHGKKGEEYYIACDYDNEGSTIGYHVLKMICGKEDGKRMKFSTLTRTDIVKSYEKAADHLDFNNIEAGITRHMLDFYYGINVSRAMMSAIKKHSKRFALITSGRVQGPTLTMLTEREKEIEKFKPVPYRQLDLTVVIGGNDVRAVYEEEKIWEKKKAEKIYKECDKKPAVIDDIEKRKYVKKPPVPFNITSLQTEAYRIYGYSPQQTLRIAQSLYTKAFVSYPRTSSEKLPPQIGYREILEAVSRIKKYSKICKKLLKEKNLVPTEGKRKDAAHEAIHPTVEPPLEPSKLKVPEYRIYDLVCRRFFSVFGKDATRENVKVFIGVNGHTFFTSGKRTVEKGWLEYYGPLSRLEEIMFPDLKKGEELKVKGLDMLDKETLPPSRYSQASIIKEMEKRGLGTRATRSNILQTLYDRNFIDDRSIRVTALGMSVAEAIKNYVPDFADEKLTETFEKDLEKIVEGKKKREKVLEKARKTVIKICNEFKENEDEIGKTLGKAVMDTQDNESILGTCTGCGKELKRLYSPKTKNYFVGCSGYKDGCKMIFPLPRNSKIIKTGKVCDKCKTPIVKVIRSGRRPFTMCLDTKCETKDSWGKSKKKP